MSGTASQVAVMSQVAGRRSQVAAALAVVVVVAAAVESSLV
jgi:hypothetical protein